MRACVAFLCFAVAFATSPRRVAEREAHHLLKSPRRVAEKQVHNLLASRRRNSTLHTGSQHCVPAGMTVASVFYGELQMVTLGSKDIVSDSIMRTGFWEVHSPESMAAKAHTTPASKKGVMLDIGANIGYYSLMFASRGYHVIAVEPMTRNRRALEASICLNPHLKSLITVVPAALTSPGESEDTYCVIRSTNYKINIGNGQMHCEGDPMYKPCTAGDGNCETVPVKTLDTVLADLAPSAIGTVKMDVEMHECAVLQGGASLFKKYRPKLLQIETEWGNASSCVQKAAETYGYHLVKDGPDTRMVADL